jgi:hypothetical protein
VAKYRVNLALAVAGQKDSPEPSREPREVRRDLASHFNLGDLLGREGAPPLRVASRLWDDLCGRPASSRPTPPADDAPSRPASPTDDASDGPLPPMPPELSSLRVVPIRETPSAPLPPRGTP